MMMARVRRAIGSTMAIMVLTAIFSAHPLPAQGPAVRWNLAYSLFNDLYYGVDAADSLHFMGIARYMGYRNTIRRSSDGGVTWRQLYVDSARAIRLCRVSYPRPDLCLVSCDSGRVLRSIDSGRTWQMIQAGPADNAGTTIHMRADGYGVLVIPRLWLAVSGDGGATWSERKLPDSLIRQRLVIWDVQRLPGNAIVAIVTDSMANWMTLRSDDLGESWQLYSGPKKCARFHFIDSLRGWAVGGERTDVGDIERDIIRRTIDGGRTWTEVLNAEIDPAFGLNSIEFADSVHGIAVGQVGKILRTSDGGDHWTQDQSGLDLHEIPQVVGIAYPVPGLAIAVTNNGEILRYRDTLPPLPAAVPLSAEDGAEMRLSPNPAPIGSPVTIVVRLEEHLVVDVRLYDLLGGEVMAGERMDLEAGEHHLMLAGSSGLRPGEYFARIVYGGMVRSLPLRVE